MSHLDKELSDLFNRQAAGQRKEPGAKKRPECLTELAVYRYLEKRDDAGEREKVEKHLLECYDCLQGMAEASKAKTEFDKGKLKSQTGSRWITLLKKELPPEKFSAPGRKTAGWLVATLVVFACSFIFPHYFVQFSTLTLLLGVKWIVETRSTKILVAIQDAYKRGDRQTAKELLEKLGKRK